MYYCQIKTRFETNLKKNWKIIRKPMRNVYSTPKFAKILDINKADIIQVSMN